MQPSNGKRKKTKRKNAISRYQKDSLTAEDISISGQNQLSQIPPEPEIASFLTIGFNSTERALEAASQSRTVGVFSSNGVASSADCSTQLVAIFVDRVDQSPALYAHFPIMASTASLHLPSDAAIRLVDLPRGATERLSAALHIPRASMIGLHSGAPDSTPLLEFVRKHVSPIEAPWLKSLQEGNYFPVKIVTKQITVSKGVEKAGPSATASPVDRPQTEHQ